MQRKTFLAWAAAALAAPSLPARADAQRLRFAHAGPDDSSQHLAALLFAKTVRERSGGRLDVQIYHNGQLGNDATVIGGVRGGTIDLMMAGSVNFAGLTPRIGALDLPFLFRDGAHAYAVLDGAVGDQLLQDLQAHQLQGLGWFEVGFRCITTRNRAVRTPADVRGLKIRTTPNPSHILAFRLLGANPVPMPLGELYQALETGAVDSQEHPIAITWSAKFYEVQKHLTLSRHAYTAMPLVMNQGRYAKLSPDLQQVLTEAARAAGRHQRELNRRDEAETLQALQDKGMQIVRDFDAQPFRQRVVEETRKAFVEKNGGELLAAIDATQATA